ncbi:hypothetical protein PtA15_6A775 [Puccinia triticina]|uniref:Uncharacterized protein n=1 Tax=Puccinia triticina TaxID=208348 RepID=A0ABY7CN54_9BASI|nr:uncharacterized protein PtA15_6A775 [Puccinia triticina]WAQ86145.1 hypothetical protein PtA15_6A775 [Puccinia triticina]
MRSQTSFIIISAQRPSHVLCSSAPFGLATQPQPPRPDLRSAPAGRSPQPNHQCAHRALTPPTAPQPPPRVQTPLPCAAFQPPCPPPRRRLQQGFQRGPGGADGRRSQPPAPGASCPAPASRKACMHSNASLTAKPSQASGAAFRQPQLRSRRVSCTESGPSARAPSALVAQETVSATFRPAGPVPSASVGPPRRPARPGSIPARAATEVCGGRPGVASAQSSAQKHRKRARTSGAPARISTARGNPPGARGLALMCASVISGGPTGVAGHWAPP